MERRITLKMARVGANLTQAEMADALGIHPTTYLKWEREPWDISIKDAVRICDIVHRELDEISFTGEARRNERRNRDHGENKRSARRK